MLHGFELQRDIKDERSEARSSHTYEYIRFQISVRKSQETLSFHYKNNWLMLYGKIIPVYSENHIKPIHAINIETHGMII
jgi:hypothetical protein